MKEIAEWALSTAALRGASYADIRIGDERSLQGPVGRRMEAEWQRVKHRRLQQQADPGYHPDHRHRAHGHRLFMDGPIWHTRGALARRTHE